MIYGDSPRDVRWKHTRTDAGDNNSEDDAYVTLHGAARSVACRLTAQSERVGVRPVAVAGEPCSTREEGRQAGKEVVSCRTQSNV